MQKTSLTHAKFLTIGELINFFMKILELEYIDLERSHTDNADKKRYQRFVKEENITIHEYNEVLEYCINSILNEILLDESLIGSAKKFINEFLESYSKMIQNVEVYPYKQQCLDYILLKYFYLPFMRFFHLYYIKTDLNLFQTSQEAPIVNILNLLGLDKNEIKKFLFTELNKVTKQKKSDKTLQQNIDNWLSNKTYPNTEHIEYLSDIFSNSLPYEKYELKQIFIIGKLINSANNQLNVKEIFEALQIPINLSIEKLIEEMCKARLNNITSLLYELYLLSDINENKINSTEIQFNQLYKKIENQGYTYENTVYLALSKARFHAQKKEFKETTKYYLVALKNGKNSMGKLYIDIIKEGLIVSAQITREKSLTLDNSKSAFVKFYKEAYFLKIMDSIPSEINQFFLNDMRKKFSLHFQHLYPQTQLIKTAEVKVCITLDELEKIKLDLKQPNKQMKNIGPNPMSQLMFFSWLLKYDRVTQLLKAGANPNEIRFNDNGTALTMILANESNVHCDDKKKNTIKKISKLLISKMSQKALDAKLPKKLMTALSMTIELGYLDIVEALIEKGADINKVVETNDVSPLYYALLQISFSNSSSKERLDNYTLPTDKKILNRINNLNDARSPFLFKKEITDEEKTEAYIQLRESQKNNLLHKIFKERYSKIMNEKYRRNQKNYYEIFNMILEANPNLENHILETGHTVLIFAAELNEIDIVKKLLEKGADKTAVTLQGNNAFDYARQNKYLELIELLK